jgi:hypothetical protein
MVKSFFYGGKDMMILRAPNGGRVATQQREKREREERKRKTHHANTQTKTKMKMQSAMTLLLTMVVTTRSQLNLPVFPSNVAMTTGTPSVKQRENERLHLL